MNKYKGFTLLEMLFSLAIFSSLFWLGALSVTRYHQTLIVQQFFQSFEKYLLYTQQSAIVQMAPTEIHFLEKENKLLFLTPNNQRAQAQFQLTIPEALQGTGPQKIVFKAHSGNNSQLKKYTFVWAEQKCLVEFQFQMGSGKYIRKTKAL